MVCPGCGVGGGGSTGYREGGSGKFKFMANAGLFTALKKTVSCKSPSDCEAGGQCHWRLPGPSAMVGLPNAEFGRLPGPEGPTELSICDDSDSDALSSAMGAIGGGGSVGRGEGNKIGLAIGSRSPTQVCNGTPLVEKSGRGWGGGWFMCAGVEFRGVAAKLPLTHSYIPPRFASPPGARPSCGGGGRSRGCCACSGGSTTGARHACWISGMCRGRFAHWVLGPPSGQGVGVGNGEKEGVRELIVEVGIWKDCRGGDLRFGGIAVNEGRGSDHSRTNTSDCSGVPHSLGNPS